MLVVSCSEPGSCKRALEEQAYIYFCDFLEECESKYGIIFCLVFLCNNSQVMILDVYWKMY